MWFPLHKKGAHRLLPSGLLCNKHNQKTLWTASINSAFTEQATGYLNFLWLARRVRRNRMPLEKQDMSSSLGISRGGIEGVWPESPLAVWRTCSELTGLSARLLAEPKRWMLLLLSSLLPCPPLFSVAGENGAEWRQCSFLCQCSSSQQQHWQTS